MREDRKKQDKRNNFGNDLPDTSDKEFLEGRNNVFEAYRAGRTVDKLFVLEGSGDYHIQRVLKEAKKAGTLIKFVSKQRLDQLSHTGAHQGVIGIVSAMEYSTIDDMLKDAGEKGEDPFIIMLDGIEDPHNLGAVIRTANAVGAHGVVITRHNAASVTAIAAKASAGAVNHTKVARVNNLGNEIDSLKKKGLWFVCADMDGTLMYDNNLTGPIGLVIGNEGKGVSRLVREKCDFTVSVPMRGQIESLNASVAAGVLSYEILRQRLK